MQSEVFMSISILTHFWKPCCLKMNRKYWTFSKKKSLNNLQNAKKKFNFLLNYVREIHSFEFFLQFDLHCIGEFFYSLFIDWACAFDGSINILPVSKDFFSSLSNRSNIPYACHIFKLFVTLLQMLALKNPVFILQLWSITMRQIFFSWSCSNIEVIRPLFLKISFGTRLMRCN